MKIYVYKEYCDAKAYGEEIIELFPDEKAAANHLKERVENHYGCKFEDVPKIAHTNEDDTVTDHYVSINNGNGTSYWIVAGQDVIGETRTEWHLRNAVSELKESATEEYEGELSDILGMTSDEAAEYGL